MLSEIPEEWNRRLELWAQQNEPLKQKIGHETVPDRNEEYFLYQTLLGVWPLDQNERSTLLERVQAHLIKATREAMVHTRWTRPNQPHEDALQKFASDLLCAQCSAAFLQDFRQFQQRIAYLGMINGLAQTLLKIASPGVVDFYQGSELWDLRLVDPDNRGPIDFARRKAALENIATDDRLQELVEHWQDGRIKMHLIRTALSFRREHQDLFQKGEFVPLEVQGQHSQNVIAFLRRTNDASVLVAVPRWLSQVYGFDARLEDNRDWQDTRLIVPANCPGEWTNLLSGRVIKTSQTQDALSPGELFRNIPVAFCYSV